MKDFLHRQPYGLVVPVDGCGVLGSSAGSEGLRRSQDGAHDFIVQNQQCGHNSYAIQQRLVSSCFSNPLNHLFSSELFQVVGGMTGTILRFALLPQSADLLRQLRCGKPTGKRPRDKTASTTQRVSVVG